MRVSSPRALLSLINLKAGLGLSSADRKHARSVNVIALIAILIFLVWIAITAIKGEPWVAVENLAFVLSLIFVIVVNCAGWHFAAAVALMTLVYLQGSFAVLAFGFESQSHLVFLALVVAPYLVFTRSRRAVAHAFAAAAGAAFVLCFVFSEALSAKVIIGSLEEQSLTNVLFSTLGLAAMAFAFLRMVDGSEDQLLEEQMRSERLLLNVLPESIANRLKDRSADVIADRHREVSILFADIVGFTVLSSRLSPPDIVAILNEIYSVFDEICDRHGVEKIRTMGDGYMAVAGAPLPRPDHAIALTRAAVEMRDYMASNPVSEPLNVRVGLNSGDVVAGVVGRTRFHFDIWGDAVNVAARMESTGEPGRIQITETMHELVQDHFSCMPRGVIEVKGKGEMRTWFVESVIQA